MKLLSINCKEIIDKELKQNIIKMSIENNAKKYCVNTKDNNNKTLNEF